MAEFFLILSWAGICGGIAYYMHTYPMRFHQIVDIFLGAPYAPVNDRSSPIQKTDTWVAQEKAFLESFGDEQSFSRAHFAAVKKSLPDRAPHEYDIIMDALLALAHQLFLIPPFTKFVSAQYPASEVRARWNTLYVAFIVALRKTLPPPPLLSEDAFLVIKNTKPFEPDDVARQLTTTYNELCRARNMPRQDLQIQALSKLTQDTHITQTKRFEHMFVCAPSGGGKTTLLTSLINRDFDAVAEGKASVIVIDSTREFAENIVSLARFGPKGDLAGKLIHIDANDVEYPIAINLFGIGEATPNLSPRDREALYNSTIAMLEYIFVALLGMELTPRQETLLRFTTALMLVIPDATIETMIEVLRPKGLAKFTRYIDGLEAPTRDFLTKDFNEPGQVERTKQEVIARLQAINSNPTVRRIFTAKKTRLDLFAEMASGKVIVINAAKDILQQQGVELLTRYFVASILLAAEKRQALRRDDRLPCFVYIDECADVVRNDTKLPTLLTQARKFNVGLILATQNIDADQISPAIADSIMGTAIKMVGRVSSSNARKFAPEMNVKAETFSQLPPFHVALSVRGLIEEAITYSILDMRFERMPKMTDSQAREVRDDMRRRYSYTPGEVTEAQKVEPEKREDMRW